ncbi:MAG: hypothetical protein PVG78_16615, partial [Desulfobacterales bacterium]
LNLFLQDAHRLFKVVVVDLHFDGLQIVSPLYLRILLLQQKLKKYTYTTKPYAARKIFQTLSACFTQRQRKDQLPKNQVFTVSIGA